MTEAEPLFPAPLDLFEPATIAYVLAVFFLGGLCKGALGLGLPVVTLSTLSLVMPLQSAMAIFMIPGVVSNLWQATSGPFLRPTLRRLWPFLLSAIIGVVVGVRILAGAAPEHAVLVLGLVLIVYASYSLLAPRLPTPGRNEIWLAPLCAASSGVLFGMVGNFMVPGILYLEALRIPRDQFIQTLGVVFLTITAALTLSMAGFQLVTWATLTLSVSALLPVGLGLWLGLRLRGRISEALYRKLFFCALIATGIYMVLRAL